MASLLPWLLIAVAGLALSWLILVLLARHLPSGPLRDLAAFLPACVTMTRTLRKDPRVPRRVRIAVLVAGIWVISPIDLIPEFLPVIGPLDDIVVVALVLRYAARKIPRDVILDAWPEDPRLITRLIGESRRLPTAEGRNPQKR